MSGPVSRPQLRRTRGCGEPRWRRTVSPGSPESLGRGHAPGGAPPHVSGGQPPHRGPTDTVSGSGPRACVRTDTRVRPGGLPWLQGGRRDPPGSPRPPPAELAMPGAADCFLQRNRVGRPQPPAPCLSPPHPSPPTLGLGVVRLVPGGQADLSWGQLKPGPASPGHGRGLGREGHHGKQRRDSQAGGSEGCRGRRRGVTREAGG